jgi:endonuclease/exonuclease/phosphatase family metal-dependent hydrolase
MSIKVMSFNLRYDTPHDGINSFTNRIPKVLDVIKSESPDIIGFQEVTDSMRYRLYRLLDGYLFAGCGRDWNYHGESMLIAYKPDLFELIKCENIWLSETPNIPGSRYGGDHSGCSRMFTQLLLKHNDIEKPFTFINTHLDHEGKNGRMLESTQLCKAISQLDGHFVLTGDFNANPSDPEIRHITESLTDKNAIDCTADIEPTFHNFGRLPKEECVKIDYIFTSGKCEKSYKVEDEAKDGVYYSDHNAVVAYINLD